MTTKDADTQFDRDSKIRDALLADLGHEGRTNFDAILVSGDIAYHGRADEFARAKLWFEDVRTKTNSNPEALFVVPGNHDVNRETVKPSSSLYDLHQILRNPAETNEQRTERLEAKLKDPFDFLAALTEYRSFAQEHACPTSCKELAWVQFLSGDKTLEDGTAVRFHGLNSALISDGEDRKANLLIGDFQFANFDGNPQYVNVVLCHHPYSWLLDGNRANDHFRTQAHIVLCGHEHDLRCYKEDESLRVYAGSLHPDRREAPYDPCYHVLRLSIDTSAGRVLLVSVETRVWREKDQCFGGHQQRDGSLFFEERIPLKVWTRPTAALPLSTSTTPPVPVSSSQEMNAHNTTSDTFTAARRKLIVHFFRVGTLSRYQAAIKAGVWEEGDDAFDGQERWARVFARAEKIEKLGALWDSVVEEDETLTGQTNPFTRKS
jgi:DNA repair exonuclease SbcCD nuclease subunit